MLDINKVYNLDCVEGMRLIDDNSIDAIITDPPYYIEALKQDLKQSTLRESSKNNIFHAEWDSSWPTLEAFKQWMEKILIEFNRILKPKGQVYMFMSYHHIDWCISMVKMLNFRYYKPLIWYKPDTMGVFPNQYGCNYEMILWFRKTGEEGEVKLNIGCGQRDVFKVNSTLNSYRKECGYHPTCKPIKIIRQLILNCSHEDDLILDPFMGSGTTAVACSQIKRKYIGFEMNQGYCATIKTRLAQQNLWNFEEAIKNDTIRSSEGIHEGKGEESHLGNSNNTEHTEQLSERNTEPCDQVKSAL